METPTSSRPWQMWSSVAMFSAASTAFTIGSRSTEVLSRIRPVSGAIRASIGNGWGHTVGCDSRCWPIDTQA